LYVTGVLLTASVAVGVALPIAKAVAPDEAALLLPSAVTDAVAVYVPAPVGSVLLGP
jgi:hypothetical protein